MLTTRHLAILNYVAANPNCSTNAVYVNTSPVCIKTGRKRTFGTYSWETPRVMQRLGLVKVVADKTLQDKHKATHGYSFCVRFLVRYNWTITAKGQRALAAA